MPTAGGPCCPVLVPSSAHPSRPVPDTTQEWIVVAPSYVRAPLALDAARARGAPETRARDRRAGARMLAPHFDVFACLSRVVTLAAFEPT